MDSTRETDLLVNGTFFAMLLSAVTLPLTDFFLSSVNADDLFNVLGSTAFMLGSILLLPPLYKILRGENKLSINDDIAALKATLTGRLIGLLLGIAFGAPAIRLIG